MILLGPVLFGDLILIQNLIEKLKNTGVSPFLNLTYQNNFYETNFGQGEFKDWNAVTTYLLNKK